LGGAVRAEPEKLYAEGPLLKEDLSFVLDAALCRTFRIDAGANHFGTLF
jgi:hypothetical protein